MIDTPATYDRTLRRGATFRCVVTWKNPNESLVNLTGYTVRVQIRQTADGGLILDLSNGAGVALGGAAGTITVTLTPAQTRAIVADYAAWEWEVTEPGGDVYVLVEGELTIKKELVRD